MLPAILHSHPSTRWFTWTALIQITARVKLATGHVVEVPHVVPLSRTFRALSHSRARTIGHRQYPTAYDVHVRIIRSGSATPKVSPPTSDFRL